MNNIKSKFRNLVWLTCKTALCSWGLDFSLWSSYILADRHALILPFFRIVFCTLKKLANPSNGLFTSNITCNMCINSSERPLFICVKIEGLLSTFWESEFVFRRGRFYHRGLHEWKKTNIYYSRSLGLFCFKYINRQSPSPVWCRSENLKSVIQRLQRSRGQMNATTGCHERTGPK